MTHHCKTLSIYFLRLYCGYFIAVLLIFIGVLTLANSFDILQKFKTIYIPLHFFWQFILCKIPYLLNEVASLISFIAMLLFFRRLTKYNELIIILCSGVHIWKVLIVPIFASLILGIIFVTIINPIGTLGLQKYNSLEMQLTNKTNDFIILQSGRLFFDHCNDSNRIIQVQSINKVTKELNNIVILFVDFHFMKSHNGFVKRIDAKQAALHDNNLNLTTVKVFTENGFAEYNNLIIPTSLSIDNLMYNVVSPEMITIWDLPNFIEQLVKFGLPIINYQIYYYKQLFKPIMMLTTVMLASCFISLKQRDNSQGKMLVNGLFLGFIIYALLEILLKILAYNNVEPPMAVLLPNMLILFISNFIILSVQDKR